MKKLILIILILLMWQSIGYSQTDSLQAMQNKKGRNTIFLEAGGNTGYISLNYDRVLKRKGKENLTLRVGATATLSLKNNSFDYYNIEDNSSINFPSFVNYINVYKNYETALFVYKYDITVMKNKVKKTYTYYDLLRNHIILPIEFCYTNGKKIKYEAALGITLDISTLKSLWGTRAFLFVRPLGIRYQRENRGLFYRAGVTPSFLLFKYKDEFIFDFLKYLEGSRFSFSMGYTF